MQVVTIRELASGVDALYLSGRASIEDELLARLETYRLIADENEGPVAFQFGGVEFHLKPHAFGKYRYCLDHPFGRIGITTSTKLPALRVQPRAEFLHGEGPRATVEWFRGLVEVECGPVLLSVSRIDLFADFQGWCLSGDDRREFVCRASDRVTHEADDEFNGLQIGKRGASAISARLYDKTIQSLKTGSAYWKTIWGERFDPTLPVLRVEFEIGREVLGQFGVNTPEEVLDATGSLWGYLTENWLSHRIPTSDQTRSRWPVSSQWDAVRHATIGENDWGITRMFDGKRAGMLFNLLPQLVGYLTSFGALTNTTSFGDMVPVLSDFLSQHALDTKQSLGERIGLRRVEFGLP